ncbi:MAG: hypothetical protein IPN36_04660, partial [Bacteroidetes bacterium]|nr:hypothetical protein [Bacteroidota bacterium]
KCHYVMHALVVGNGSEYPVAILFPNKTMLTNPNYELLLKKVVFVLVT